MSTSWPDEVDEIIGGDQAVALAYATPAGGTVITPVTNFATRDRTAGTVEVNSSIGMWRKLQRIAANPNVALAFHTRTHGYSSRPEYVLVQGKASLSAPIRDFPAKLGDAWERFDGPLASGPLWKWWLRVYYLRVRIEVTVQRVTVWPTLECADPPEVHGEQQMLTPPAAQRPPAKGPEPRLDPGRAAAYAARLPNVLLGWVGADGYPFVVPVRIEGSEPDGIVLGTPTGLVPRASQRAGLTAHSFTRYVLGQDQRVHTGWMESEPAMHRVVYAPHTSAGHRLPPVTLLYRLAVGHASRRGLAKGLRDGVIGRDGRFSDGQ